MATQIEITFGKEKYTLEFSRRTAAQIEDRGFELGKLASAPNLMIPLLVSGAFAKNHPKMRQSECMKIYEHITDKIREDKNGDEQSFLMVLAEMYSETLDTLTDKVEEGNAATWEVKK